MMKKLVALILAVVMVMAMGSVAFASSVGMENQNGVIGEFTTVDTPVVQANSVLLYKEITAYNKDASTVNAPEMEYSYKIEAGSADMTVKDAGGANLHETKTPVEVKTKAGLTGATISGSVDSGTTYTPGKLTLTNAVQLTTADAGAANKFPLKVDFSGVIVNAINNFTLH